MERAGRIDMLLELLQKEPFDTFLNYVLGLEYIEQQDLQRAEIQLKKVVALDEDYIAVYYQLGKLFEGQLRNTEALSYYNTGLEKAKAKKDNKAINEFGEAIFMLED